jgi:hypothetical protein
LHEIHVLSKLVLSQAKLKNPSNPNMNTKLLNTFAAASAVLLTVLGTASARAGTITVVNLPQAQTDLATGINTNKHYVCTFSFGNGTAPGNINGVPFTHYVLPNISIRSYVQQHQLVV